MRMFHIKKNTIFVTFLQKKNTNSLKRSKIEKKLDEFKPKKSQKVIIYKTEKKHVIMCNAKCQLSYMEYGGEKMMKNT